MLARAALAVRALMCSYISNVFSPFFFLNCVTILKFIYFLIRFDRLYSLLGIFSFKIILSMPGHLILCLIMLFQKDRFNSD